MTTLQSLRLIRTITNATKTEDIPNLAALKYEARHRKIMKKIQNILIKESIDEN